MGTQEYRATYRVAMQEATSDLNRIYREFEQLQLRKEQIEDALTALQPFIASGSSFVHQQPEQAFEQVTTRSTSQETKFEVLAPQAAREIEETTAPAPFAPVPDLIVDPIQNRINRALGLAVA